MNSSTDILRGALDALAEKNRHEAIACLQALIGNLHVGEDLPQVAVAIAGSFYEKRAEAGAWGIFIGRTSEEARASSPVALCFNEQHAGEIAKLWPGHVVQIRKVTR